MEQTIQSYNRIFWELVSDYDLNESNILEKWFILLMLQKIVKLAVKNWIEIKCFKEKRA